MIGRLLCAAGGLALIFAAVTWNTYFPGLAEGLNHQLLGTLSGFAVCAGGLMIVAAITGELSPVVERFMRKPRSGSSS